MFKFHFLYYVFSILLFSCISVHAQNTNSEGASDYLLTISDIDTVGASVVLYVGSEKRPTFQMFAKRKDVEKIVEIIVMGDTVLVRLTEAEENDLEFTAGIPFTYKHIIEINGIPYPYKE